MGDAVMVSTLLMIEKVRTIAGLYKVNSVLVTRAVKGVDPDQLVLRPEGRGNSMYWMFQPRRCAASIMAKLLSFAILMDPMGSMTTPISRFIPAC